MVRFFKERNTFQIPLLVMLSFILKALLVYYPQPQSGELAGGMLPKWFSLNITHALTPGAAAFISALLIWFSAIYANYVLMIRKMVPRGTIVVAVSIIMFTALFPGSNQLTAAILMLPVSIFIFQQTTQLYGLQNAKTGIINIGLITGLSYLLYHPFIWYIPCCFFGLASMRPFKITEWLLLLMGLIAPAYFVLSYEFITDQWHPLNHVPSFNLNTKLKLTGTIWYTAVSLAAIWLLAALAGWQQLIRRMLIQSRKNWYHLLAAGLCTLPALVAPKVDPNEIFVLLSFPLGAVSANVFQKKEQNLPTVILFWILFFGIIAIELLWIKKI